MEVGHERGAVDVEALEEHRPLALHYGVAELRQGVAEPDGHALREKWAGTLREDRRGQAGGNGLP